VKNISNGTAISQLPITLPSYAKLNLSLAVSEEIVDGKHLLQSVFTTIDLSDQLCIDISAKAEPAVTIDMTFAERLHRIQIPLQKNIIYQAICEYLNQLEQTLPINLHITVQKNIPTQAGLGGGSSNAAAALNAMQMLCDNTLSTEQLRTIAAILGADVSFFLDGGCALMTGHGEHMVARLWLPPIDIVLVKPDFGLSTALVYQQFDRSPKPAGNIDAMVDLLQPPSRRSNKTVNAENLAALLTNNLTQAAESLAPEIANITAALERQPGICKAMLAGSGSTVFAIAKDRQSALSAAKIFDAQGLFTKVCKTI